MVKDAGQGKSGRGKRGNGPEGGRGILPEKEGDLGQGAAPFSRLQNASPDHADHLVEKSGACDPKDKAVGVFVPENSVDSPGTVLRKGGGDGEMAKIVGS